MLILSSWNKVEQFELLGGVGATLLLIWLASLDLRESRGNRKEKSFNARLI